MGFFAYVNKDFFYVNVTFPSSFVSGTNGEDYIAQAEEDGIEATINGDGSITYRMNRLQHYLEITEQKREILWTIKEIIAHEEHPSIHDIKYNNSFSELTILVNWPTYEGTMDGMVSVLLGLLCVKYQLYNGASLENYHVKVTIQDKETYEVISDTVVPW